MGSEVKDSRAPIIMGSPLQQSLTFQIKTNRVWSLSRAVRRSVTLRIHIFDLDLTCVKCDEIDPVTPAHVHTFNIYHMALKDTPHS